MPWRYTHDAWNRLVKIERDNGDTTFTVRAAYEYNGLNWRIVKQVDDDLDDEIDTSTVMYYSASWQLLEERIDDDVPAEDGDERHRQYVWGPRYIDDIVLQRVDNDLDGTFGESGEPIYYHLTDVQFSTVAIVKDGPDTVQERNYFDAYGRSRLHRGADLDGDRDVDGVDQGILLSKWGNPSVHIADLNFDGKVDGFDQGILLSMWNSSPPTVGDLSLPGVDNIIGWDGYVFNAEMQQYQVRNRVYDPVQGRWLERDRLRYPDGMSLYQFTASSPLVNLDPLGLVASSLTHPSSSIAAAYAALMHLSPAEAAVILAAAGYSVEEVARITGLGVRYVQKLIEGARAAAAIAAAMAILENKLQRIRAAIERLMQEVNLTTCDAAREFVRVNCHPEPKSCRGALIPANPISKLRPCNDYIDRAIPFKLCAIGRGAVLLLCSKETDHNRFAHLERFFNMVRGMMTCYKKYAECMKDNGCDVEERPNPFEP